MNILNSIYLRRKNKVVLNSSNGKLNPADLATMLKNLESLGYTFSSDLIERVATLSLPEASLFYSQLVEDLQQALGANVKYTPMYPNFPIQVMEMAEAELYLNAIVHYVGRQLGVRLLPQYATQSRPALADKIELTIISLGTEAELWAIFNNLLTANTSWSESDRQDLSLFARTCPKLLVEMLPKEIANKENLAFIAGLVLRHGDDAEKLLTSYFKTATDVLRLATAMSEGDISLAENTRFRNFSRPERRLLLGLLERCGAIAEDMMRHQKRWLRLGERLHPFEYKKRYPKSCQAFDIVRNDKPFKTFHSSLETAYVESRWDDALSLLQTRAGELARKLDFLLRNNNALEVLNTFERVADKVATPILLQLITHFESRNEKRELRVFFPKGNVAKAYAINNQLPAIDESVCQAVVAICDRVLIARFACLPDLGKVYIDERLQNFPVPFAQRSASKALRQLSRGSRLPIADGDTVRFFIWWKEGMVNNVPTNTVDIDLSAVIYDADWNYLEHISYTNLKSSKYQAVHSGDIVSAPDGASEFIDLNLTAVLKSGGRYVVASVLSFSEHPFGNLPECFAGWMIRQDGATGEIYDPRTVDNKVDLTANTTITIPAILDLEQREVLWTDMSLHREPSWGRGNNVENNRKGMVLIGKAMTSLNKPHLERLFRLHATARGEIVEDMAIADTVFSVKEGTTPFDIEKIAAQYLL